tara:strand:- start:84 stop:212 length:129 start_codon:yes stop_codon:yes gene_type:complete
LSAEYNRENKRLTWKNALFYIFVGIFVQFKVIKIKIGSLFTV